MEYNGKIDFDQREERTEHSETNVGYRTVGNPSKIAQRRGMGPVPIT